LIDPLFRRRYYKFEDGVWWSFSQWGEGVKSGNSDDWFAGEIIQGYFKEINEQMR
jgi:hypothetical protein